MLEIYIKNIDDMIMTSDVIIDVQFVRRSIWDSGLEIIGFYRYKVFFSDGSLLELSERLLEENDTLTTTKYRFHWQDRQGEIIKRWDNAAHFPQLETFPHHLHAGSETHVVSHQPMTGMEVLLLVIDHVSQKPATAKSKSSAQAGDAAPVPLEDGASGKNGAGY